MRISRKLTFGLELRGPKKSATEYGITRGPEYGLSTARSGIGPKFKVSGRNFPGFAPIGPQKNAFAKCHKIVVFAVDSGERPNLYTHPSARRTALYGLTARLRNPHWFSEKGFR